MGASEIAAFPTWLATVRRVSASTQNQALSALLFLYRDEVARVMKHLDGVMWIMVALLYGSGLRLQGAWSSV